MKESIKNLDLEAMEELKTPTKLSTDYIGAAHSILKADLCLLEASSEKKYLYKMFIDYAIEDCTSGVHKEEGCFFNVLNAILRVGTGYGDQNREVVFTYDCITRYFDEVTYKLVYRLEMDERFKLQTKDAKLETLQSFERSDKLVCSLSEKIEKSIYNIEEFDYQLMLRFIDFADTCIPSFLKSKSLIMTYLKMYTENRNACSHKNIITNITETPFNKKLENLISEYWNENMSCGELNIITGRYAVTIKELVEGNNNCSKVLSNKLGNDRYSRFQKYIKAISEQEEDLIASDVYGTSVIAKKDGIQVMVQLDKKQVNKIISHMITEDIPLTKNAFYLVVKDKIKDIL